MLYQDDFPFFLPKALNRFVTHTPVLQQAIREGSRTGFDDCTGTWMVFDRSTVVEGMTLLVGIRDAADGTMSTQEDQEAVEAAAESLNEQLCLAFKYYEEGWKPGLHVPWGKPAPFPSWTYMVHLARLERDPVAPYRLRVRYAICHRRNITASQCEVQIGAEVTCGGCLAKREGNPDYYPLLIKPTDASVTVLRWEDS